MDGREIVIKSKPGEVIKPEGIAGKPFMKIVKDEGMPSRGNPFVCGNLYVLFMVQFPEEGELSPDTVAILKATLPNPSMNLDYAEDEAQVVNLDHADVKQFGKGGAAIEENGHDSDGDDPRGGAVQCQQS